MQLEQAEKHLLGVAKDLKALMLKRVGEWFTVGHYLRYYYPMQSTQKGTQDKRVLFQQLEQFGFVQAQSFVNTIKYRIVITDELREVNLKAITDNLHKQKAFVNQMIKETTYLLKSCQFRQGKMPRDVMPDGAKEEENTDTSQS